MANDAQAADVVDVDVAVAEDARAVSDQPLDERERPPDVDVAVAEGPDPADADDDDDEFEWIQGWSAEYSVYYYFHVPTGTTSWEAPETYKPYSPDDVVPVGTWK